MECWTAEEATGCQAVVALLGDWVSTGIEGDVGY